MERLSIISTTIGSQQEAKDLLNAVNGLIEKFSSDRLNDIIPPALVIAQKGRMKNTKREKIALEHQADNLKVEMKTEKRKNKEAEKLIMKKRKVEKKTPEVLYKPSLTSIKNIKKK